MKESGAAGRGALQNLEEFLQLDDEGPVGFGQVFAEVFLARVDRFAANLFRVVQK